MFGTWNLRSKIQFELNIAMFQVNLCFRSCPFLTFVYCSSSVDVYNSLLSSFLLFFFLTFSDFSSVSLGGIWVHLQLTLVCVAEGEVYFQVAVFLK